MSTESQNLLANFVALPRADRLWVADEITRLVAIEEMGSEKPGSEDKTPAYKLDAHEWKQRFHAWADKQRLRNALVDDSRESIYEGCGE